MSVKTPCSTAPKSESCCDLLKRWISSMNSSGAFWSKNRCLRADSITSRTSFTPDVTAERVKNGRSNCVATIFASVVLPTPGGPQRMNDGTLPVSKNLRNTPFLPTRCSCPIYSSIVRGRSRSAKGMFGMTNSICKSKDRNCSRNFLSLIKILKNDCYALCFG